MAARATKLKSGKWRCKAYYTDETGKYTSKSFTADTKKEAERDAAVYLMEREHDNKPENITVGRLADTFIDSLANLRSPSTIAAYKKIRRTALQSISDVRLGVLTKELYQKAISEYSKGRSPKTVKNAHMFYKQILEDKGFKFLDRITLPPPEKHEVAIPTKDEINKFLSFIAGSRIYNYVLFAVCLGLRRSEIVGLRWKNIDFDNKKVIIERVRVKDEFYQWVEKAPKSYCGKRVLDAPQALLEAIEPLRSAPDDYVFDDSPDALEGLYKRAKAQGNFPYNFHSLRHFYASMMLALGVPNRYARVRMGHATESMIVQVYQHTIDEYDKEISNKIDNYFTDNIEIKALKKG